MRRSKLLDDTVKAFQSALQLPRTATTAAPRRSPMSTQARTQLQAAQVQATDVDIQRAHVRTRHRRPHRQASGGVHAAARPDHRRRACDSRHSRNASFAVAGAPSRHRLSERSMAAANEQIGIAQAAYYPTLSLSAVAGFAGTSAVNWFSWPSRFFAVGPTLSETLYDHGRRRATSDIALAQYDGTVAAYRQTTLTAFQQVEDNLNALHNLEIEAEPTARRHRLGTAIARPLQYALRGWRRYLSPGDYLADRALAKSAQRHRDHAAAFRSQRTAGQGSRWRMGCIAASRSDPEGLITPTRSQRGQAQIPAD